jgi:hypothetical protein
MTLDLIRGALVTIALGLPVLAWGDLLPDRWWKSPLAASMLILSIGAGISTFARKHRERLVPISAIYIVVMVAVLLFLAFQVAWRRGRVEL